MNMLLRDFNAELGREDIFKSTVGNESLHKISNCSGQQIVILVVANVRERLAVSKQTTHGFHMERFNLKKLNEVEGK
jgi:hypothetical protein